MTRLLVLALALTFTACQSADDPASAPEVDAGAIDRAVDTDDVITEAAAPFDVNTATEEQMRTIPGVGDRMVHEFEEYRPYASIRQFRQEIGKYVDEAQVAAYEEYLFVPIDMNESDAETLAQLPGVSAEAAELLIDGRPYATMADFQAAYESTASEPDWAVASVYVAR
ncbi:hypothetical protein [Rubrivirga sp. IMCC43871]|uniref:hypothetical protein n=1 Tax=Rubrivirga sp. IMCC43871 TaxID=3391575 RepID=UPI00398FA448